MGVLERRNRDKDNETGLKEGGGIKKTCLGVLERGNRDKANETGLKEGGGIEMSTTALSNTYLPNWAP